MSDDLNDLLHLGDFPFSADTSTDTQPCVKAQGSDERLLSERDKISINQLATLDEVQDWCSSRMIEYRHHIHDLRVLHGAASRDTISTTKSHIRALRSVYNDAAPINRHLLPELLIEIFSHVHPAVMPRPGVSIPVLRVCRYWRSLLLRTPHFWSNLLSLPSWKFWNRKHQLGRFKAALSRSGSIILSLYIPYCDGIIADILMPEAGRIASLQVGPTVQCTKNVAQVLEQDMPRLAHLAIIQWSGQYNKSTLDIDFSRHRNISVLELERTYIFAPVSPYTSLSHLTLRYCIICPPPTSGSTRALYAVHNALEFFPNLETLAITHCLADDDPAGLRSDPPPEPTKTINLPRLRLLELHDIPAYIPPFLSRLAFPPTTALVLEPGPVRSHPPVPLFPGINPTPSGSPSPAASLSLHLDLASPHAGRAIWETHCNGTPNGGGGDGAEAQVRPVRVVLTGAADRTTLIVNFSRDLAAALGPVTKLTAKGPSGVWAYWIFLLPGLPRLRSLAYDAGRTDTREVVRVLGGGTRALCPELVRLALAWHIPPRVEVGEREVWRALLERGDEDDGLGAAMDGQEDLEVGEGEEDLGLSLWRFCDTLRASLVQRANRPCERIRDLLVAPRQWRYDGTSTVFEEWQMALVEQRLRERLGGSVENIAVVKDLY